MKILHTADWHLGDILENQKRYDEFEKTLSWLVDEIARRGISALLISGDVFNTKLPTHEAQRQYYDFLVKARAAGTRDVVVIAGNHDSPSFLQAPRQVLSALNVWVVGDTENTADCIVPLTEAGGRVCAVVCAVPYIPGRYVADGDAAAQNDAYIQEVAACYGAVCNAAKAAYPGIPLIAMGHLTAAGDEDAADDEVIGNLRPVPLTLLPMADLSYLALGHLHEAHAVKGQPKAWYAGSLLRMSLADAAKAPRQMLLLDTDDLSAPEPIGIPQFLDMAEIAGTMGDIAARLAELKALERPVWTTVTNTGPFLPTLAREVDALVEGSQVVVLAKINAEPNPAILHRLHGDEHLRDLRPADVFNRLLESVPGYTDEDKDMLKGLFAEIVDSLDAEDANKA